MNLSLGIDIGSSSTKRRRWMSMALCLVRFRFTRMTRAPRYVFSAVLDSSQAARLYDVENNVLDRARFDVFP